jgi:hypothetical protein
VTQLLTWCQGTLVLFHFGAEAGTQPECCSLGKFQSALPQGHSKSVSDEGRYLGRC